MVVLTDLLKIILTRNRNVTNVELLFYRLILKQLYNIIHKNASKI